MELKEAFLLQQRELEITSLLEVTKAINENIGAEDLFKIFGFTVRGHFDVSRILIFYKKDEDWECTLNDGVEADLLNQMNIPADVNDFDEAGSFIGTNLDYESRFDYFIPVHHKDHALAYVFIKFNDYQEKSWDNQLKFIKTITNIIVVAIENKRLFKKQILQERLRKEMEVARQVQQSLIPETLPRNEMLEMDSVYLPHSAVGGDYFDYIQLSEHEHLFCVADVSGKGVGASLMMANFQARLRALAVKGVGLRNLVNKLNAAVEQITKGESFITMIIAKYNSKTKKLAYINSGHPAGLLIMGGKVFAMDKGSTILGAFAELPFIKQQSKQLMSNALVLFFSDGLTDVFSNDNESFDFDRIAAFGLAHQNESVQRFNELLLEEIESFRGEQEYIDDITFLCSRLH